MYTSPARISTIFKTAVRTRVSEAWVIDRKKKEGGLEGSVCYTHLLRSKTLHLSRMLRRRKPNSDVKKKSHPPAGREKHGGDNLDWYSQGRRSHRAHKTSKTNEDHLRPTIEACQASTVQRTGLKIERKAVFLGYRSAPHKTIPRIPQDYRNREDKPSCDPPVLLRRHCEAIVGSKRDGW